ncbi:anhydro-N-acetylmuramic acid kinase [Sphingomonas bacterium]|uniref:anhydro-N-acetylmuramic acid kinase n=1 Tax=Sphingomonas bacterium TaxID=1895847 RepID=UPI001576C80C|nr:anhydro-N-acetylmuramic acid kinase [Sphingomonas bacterium]
MRVLGFMSGTSLDGVDAAILDTDGVAVTGLGPALLLPFTQAEREVLLRATADALRTDGAEPAPASFGEASRTIVAAHVRAARALLARPEAGTIELIGFHGQTVLHRPERGLSIQLGDPAALAAALGVPVVARLRQRDLAAGGQGAPLVPVYHAALAHWLGSARPVAFLNVGGVANVSFVGEAGELTAFDTGPGNGLIDLMLQQRTGARYDDGGRLAAGGRVDQAALQAMMTSPYLDRPGPKSLDRHDFSLDPVAALDIADAAATLTAFTAASVADAVRHLPAAPRCWVVCGGGRHNRVMMAALRARLPLVTDADALGLRGDFLEAEAFAFLAARSVRGLPITFPGTTGVGGPTTGGEVFRP